jgi:hypothetical protein
MTVKSAVTFALMAGVLAVALAAPAEAARKYRRLAAEQPTRTIYYTPSGRRIVVVTPRSYLDPGTEVMPGERKFSDYALPPGQSDGYAAYPDHNDFKGSWTRMPFPSCWDLGNCGSGYGH